MECFYFESHTAFIVLMAQAAKHLAVCLRDLWATLPVNCVYIDRQSIPREARRTAAWDTRASWTNRVSQRKVSPQRWTVKSPCSSDTLSSRWWTQGESLTWHDRANEVSNVTTKKGNYKPSKCKFHSLKPLCWRSTFSFWSNKHQCCCVCPAAQRHLRQHPFITQA